MRRSVWIIWLLLCLLPLRGWAQAGMPFAAVASPGPGAVSAAPPCHAAEAGEAAGATQPSTGHLGCGLCDLCHTSALPTVELAWSPQRPRDAVPPDRQGPDTGLCGPGRLERPPRPTLG